MAMPTVHLLIDSLEVLTSGSQPGGSAGRPAYHHIQVYETLDTTQHPAVRPAVSSPPVPSEVLTSRTQPGGNAGGPAHLSCVSNKPGLSSLVVMCL